MILIMTVKENKLKLKCKNVLEENSAAERANARRKSRGKDFRLFFYEKILQNLFKVLFLSFLFIFIKQWISIDLKSDSNERKIIELSRVKMTAIKFNAIIIKLVVFHYDDVHLSEHYFRWIILVSSLEEQSIETWD